MMNPYLYPIPFLAVFVFLTIRAQLLKKQRQVYVFKPLSTLLVIAVICLAFSEPSQNLTYTLGILVGLILSLGGDIALMFDHKRAFAAGLALFLLAHIAYIVTFSLLSPFSSWEYTAMAALAAAGLGFYRLIRSGLGKLKGPVIAYILIISLMVSRAFSTLFSPNFSEKQGLLIFFGALLFYLSDMILAANRFWRPWKYNRISLLFYYSGQLLLALAAAYF
jgi:uncharacterized membrane protein YhhN